jgi:hypothetical protein
MTEKYIEQKEYAKIIVKHEYATNTNQGYRSGSTKGKASHSLLH